MDIKNITDKKMPSVTEWMEKINFKNINHFRQEDNNKRDRLEILNKEIGLRYDRPEKMMALDIVNKTPKFLKILSTLGKEKCALRLVPITPKLPKLRVRGKTLEENLKWFNKLKINHSKYKVEIIPHNDETKYSAIFIVNDTGIWGEIVPGAHWQLTQGLYKNQVMSFVYDFQTWKWSKKYNYRAKKIIKDAIRKILTRKNKQAFLKTRLRAKFTPHGYLEGYFEFVVWPKIGTSFIDYNRVTYRLFNQKYLPNINNNLEKPNATTLYGQSANKGRAIGIARIVKNPKEKSIKNGEILICTMTMVDHIELMKKSGAIITEYGTLLSHAAIVARELKKPCIVGVKDATKKIKDGQSIIVDANQGTVILLPT